MQAAELQTLTTIVAEAVRMSPVALVLVWVLTRRDREAQAREARLESDRSSMTEKALDAFRSTTAAIAQQTAATREHTEAIHGLRQALDRRS